MQSARGRPRLSSPQQPSWIRPLCPMFLLHYVGSATLVNVPYPKRSVITVILKCKCGIQPALQDNRYVLRAINRGCLKAPCTLADVCEGPISGEPLKALSSPASDRALEQPSIHVAAHVCGCIPRRGTTASRHNHVAAVSHLLTRDK